VEGKPRIEKNMKKLKHRILQFSQRKIRKSSIWLTRFKWYANTLSPESIVLLDYPLTLGQRYTHEKPHALIYNLFTDSIPEFFEHLNYFSKLTPWFKKIPINGSESNNPTDPIWENIWFSGLDLISLYGFICKFKPKKYLEVGSGNSTKVAFQAIKDHELGTRIISIDPNPRTEINNICDEIIRQPLEKVDLKIFETLEAGDILFIDNSHRLFMNSDVQVVFMDIIPSLKKGVLIHIHDIFLPYDYPKNWINRYYSEQYVLAPFILYAEEKFEILLPNYFLSQNQDAIEVISKIYKNENKDFKEPTSASFWMLTK